MTFVYSILSDVPYEVGMKIDLKKLIGAYGDELPFSGTADLSAEELYSAQPFQSPVHYEGKIANKLGVLRLIGTVKTIYSTCCSRCLKPLDIMLTAEVDMVLSRDADAVEEDDVFPITEESVEVEDIFIPALILQVEMTYLCKDDCKGLCSQCGCNRNETSCSCASKEIDPRLAVLAKLLEKKQDE